MKSKCIWKLIWVVFFVSLSISIAGCSSDSSSSGGGGTTTDTTVTVAAVEVNVSPSSVIPGENSTIQATVYDSSGKTIPDASVIFTLDDPTLAYFSKGSVSTNSSGVAEVTLTARDKSGEVEITATADSVSNDTVAVLAIQSGTVPNDINLTVSPTSIIVEGTATVTAEVLDLNQSPVSDGTTVTFLSGNTLFGDFTSPTTTTTNGFATATFEATSEQGTASVTVSSGNVSKQANITIFPAEATAIEFSSATPQQIFLQGSGGIETSIIQFLVKDSNSNPVEGINVSFVMDGPNGGEFIDPTPGDATPKEIDVSTDANGVAQVILNSGSVAGPVTIRGTILVQDDLGNQIPIVAQSSTVSIGGGVPSERRFTLAASVLNLPGLEEVGVETEIMAFLADRFGNYNILQGTTVSFVSEVGLAIDTSNVTTDENGYASSIARTQLIPEDVLPLSWETQLKNTLQTIYGLTLASSANPRDGLCSVLVYVKGEEHFEDQDANGSYDLGETFTDTFDDPFIDYNDNGLYDGSASSDPFEDYIDSGTANGSWNGVNGVWDADKNIFDNFKILITGQEVGVFADRSSFSVPNGGTVAMSVVVCDRNGNPLTPGSKVTVSVDKGKLSGGSRTFSNSNVVGPTATGHLNLIKVDFSISDSSTTDTDPPENSNVTVTVEWKGELSTITTTYNNVVTGTVD